MRLFILVHPEDWGSLPRNRQSRYARAIAEFDDTTLITDNCQLAAPGQLIGRRWSDALVGSDTTLSDLLLPTDLAPYLGSDDPMCRLPRWEHHLSELLVLDYPCRALGLRNACDPSSSEPRFHDARSQGSLSERAQIERSVQL